MAEPLTQEQEDRLRKLFKIGNRFMVSLWKFGLGKHVNALPKHGGQVLVIQHTGRTSGKVYQTPVNYSIVNDEIYCVAGFGPDTDWYRNILANPQVEIWLPDSWWAGIVEDILDPQLRMPILRQVLLASGFAAKAFGIYVEQMTDEELDHLTHDYRLVRIRRTTARTGPGGPGDLAWIWPITTMVLLFMWMFRRRR
jgi:deazaflavin-dependent oxidoreductase (nitroreductase family)